MIQITHVLYVLPYVGTSPHTYIEDDNVREGENVVRVRAQCLGQVNSRPTRDLSIGKLIKYSLISSVKPMSLFVADICCPLVLGNGTVACELGANGGPNAGDACNMSCDPGFIMDGSDSRMCTDLGKWTGDATTCTARMHYVCS